MILASAQTNPVKSFISKNLTDHYRLINIASGYGADLIVFLKCLSPDIQERIRKN